VTTGNIGSFPPSPLVLGDISHVKYWTGTNGKYETINGGERQKWNNYSMDVIASTCSQPYFKLKKEFIPNPSSPGGTVFEDVPVGWNNGFLAFDNDQFYTPKGQPLGEALDKLISKVKGHDFNLGVETGQAKQTVGLLAGNLSKLGLAALALKRGDFSTAARHLGTSPRGTRLKVSDISGRWLELQYGWLPLLSSSFEAATAFAEISNGPRSHIFEVRRRRQISIDLSTAPGTYKLKFSGYLRTALQYEMYEEMSIQRQLGLYDPLSIAWELTPWSFVVDWFVPFGTYLSSLNQIPHLKGRYLVTDTIKCDKSQCKATYVGTNFGGSNWRGTVLQVPSFQWGYTKTRRVYQESPPQVPFPKFKFGLNSPKRFWNAVSLAHQRFKGN
jgi:hypothetical protein